MKLIIDIPEECLKNISNAFVFEEVITKRTIDIILDAITNGTPLDKISDEIQKVINAERDFTSENARAQAIALNWCLDIIDKYTKE